MLKQNLPEPLRGIEIPSFTHDSIVKRLPEIARRTLAENDFPPSVVAKIEQLIAEIPAGPIRGVDLPLAPYAADWEGYIRPYLGQDWLSVPWFFAEEYFYVRILEATDYFHPGPGQGVDPYALQKRLGLESTRDAIRLLSEQLAALHPDRQGFFDVIHRLMLIALWGNQNDLSLWPASQADDPQVAAGGGGRSAMRESLEHLLVDERPAAIHHLKTRNLDTARVDFLIDNAGYELVCDLALADILLAYGQHSRVVFHVKCHPVFVSDALPKDVLDTLTFLKNLDHAAARDFAARLDGHLAAGRFRVLSHPFWTSPLPMWELPDELAGELAQADLLISKGDANYRRLLGDRHWPLDTPFGDVLAYLPVAVLSLRTLKSEIAVGLSPSQIPQHDPQWMSNGRWGLIQFAARRV